MVAVSLTAHFPPRTKSPQPRVIAGQILSGDGSKHKGESTDNKRWGDESERRLWFESVHRNRDASSKPNTAGDQGNEMAQKMLCRPV